MASPDTLLTQPSDLNRFLHATVGTERNGADLNGMDLSVLSMLARLGRDPWMEAARLVGLPGAAAVDSLSAAVAGLPVGSQPGASARELALRLVSLLPVQARAAAGTGEAGRRRGNRDTAVLLAGVMLGASLVMGLLIGATAEFTPRACPPRAGPPHVLAEAAAASAPPPDETSRPSPGGP